MGSQRWVLVAVAVAVILGAWFLRTSRPAAEDAPPARAAMGALEERTDRSGSDLSRHPLPANNAGECAGFCEAEADCKAMTWVKHPDMFGGVCWLKGAVPAPSENEAAVSAVKREAGS